MNEVLPNLRLAYLRARVATLIGKKIRYVLLDHRSMLFVIAVLQYKFDVGGAFNQSSDQNSNFLRVPLSRKFDARRSSAQGSNSLE
jgi:hypothetical protein